MSLNGTLNSSSESVADLALLGHDLRAALSEVIGGLRLIDSATLDRPNRQRIARCRAASEALVLIMEQTLMVLLDEDRDDPALLPMIATGRLIRGLRVRWESKAQAVGIDFALQAALDLPRLLPLDPALIERVLANLLGNAFKYAPKGRIRCGFALPAPNTLEITVQDDGPGFPDDLLAKMFLAPARAPNSDKPGSGLGMLIVQGIVLAAEGSITARNLTPSGAEVVVRLPFDANRVAMGDDHATEPLPDLAQVRLLVADNNETARSLIATTLGRMGADVVAVADGVAAIGRLERETFDALIVDIEMPKFSGLDVIRYLRSVEGPLARLPILALTAYSLRSNRKAIEAAGATDVLSKLGLVPAAFGAAILAALGRDGGTPIAAPPNDNDTELTQLDRLLDIASPTDAQDLLARLIEDLRDTERGLLGAARGPNWTSLQAQTHVLIALAGTAGATRLQFLSEALNDLAHQNAPDRGTFLTLLPETLEALDALIHLAELRAMPDIDRT